MNKRVIVETYNPKWKTAFIELQNQLLEALQTRDYPILHIGSTSIEGLCAKPIIDLAIIIKSDMDFEYVKKHLENKTYKHVGDQGILHREVFKSDTPFPIMNHHLYVIYKDALALKNHLTLKKHLQNNPIDKEAYCKLKRDLASKYPNDIDSYVTGKTDFIISILKQYDFTQEELDSIIQINK